MRSHFADKFYSDFKIAEIAKRRTDTAKLIWPMKQEMIV